MNNSNNKSVRRYGTRSMRGERSRSRTRHNENNNANVFVSGINTNSTRKKTNSMSRSSGKYVPSTEKKISTVYLEGDNLFIRKPAGATKGIPVRGKIKSGDNVWLIRSISHSDSKFKYGRVSKSDTFTNLEVWDKLPEEVIKGTEVFQHYKNIRKKDGDKKYTWKSEWYTYEADKFKLEDAE